MTKKVDIEKARELRAQGKSLQEVADEVGCSLAWCKANLKGTKAPSKDKPLVEAVRALGRTKDGVVSSEVRQMVREAYKGLHGKDLETKVNDIKRSARRDSPDVLIRPYWLLPECSADCAEIILEYAQEVWQFKEFLADKYRRHFDLDASFHNSIIYALTAMSAGDHNKLMPQGLLSHGRQLTNICEELDSRQHGNAPQAVNMAVDFADSTDEYATQDADCLGDLATLDDLFPLS